MEAFVHGELDEFIPWYDTDGNIINASDGGIIYVDGVYHWYGMALRPLPTGANGKGGQSTTTGVVMYASEDLYHWKYEGVFWPVHQIRPVRFMRRCVLKGRKFCITAKLENMCFGVIM